MRAVHRHTPAHGSTHTHGHAHEHESEPQRGLPEALPAGERLLWQGSPDWRSLALRAFHLRKLAVYFALLLVLRAAFDLGDGKSPTAAVAALGGLALLAAVALGLVALLAWLSATQTVYTITSRRVVMRIGIVLTVTYNLPYAQIVGAALLRHRDGSGDLPLELAGTQRIAFLQLWPHVRPWQVRRTQPMLRCVPQAEQVAAVLTQAWREARAAMPAVAEAPATTTAPVAAPAAPETAAPAARGEGGRPMHPSLAGGTAD